MFDIVASAFCAEEFLVLRDEAQDVIGILSGYLAQNPSDRRFNEALLTPDQGRVVAVDEIIIPLI